MPKAKGLDANQVKAMLADEVDPQDEPRDIAPTPAPPAYQPEPAPVVAAPAPPAAATIDVASLVQMLAAAMQQSGQSTAQAIRDGLADATAMARAPIPENEVPLDRGVYGNPHGPRTKLRCPMYLGVYNEHGKSTPAFEIFQDVCTEQERVLLNQLQRGDYTVMRNDEREAICKVVEEKDSLGQTTRLVIAVPNTWLSKEEQAQMPSQLRLLRQLTAPAEAAA